MKGYFVSGIGTDVGKTVVSAIVTEALRADYWKPVQSGSLDVTDTQKVRSWVSNAQTVFHPEAWSLEAPLSPHAAAARENTTISLEAIQLPATHNTLVVEGAGGLLVPLNDRHLVIDLVQKTGLPVILVSANYLGSINHTLLSWEALKSRRIPIAGLVFNGDPNPETEDFILQYTGLMKLLSLRKEAEITPEVIKRYAAAIQPFLDTRR